MKHAAVCTLVGVLLEASEAYLLKRIWNAYTAHFRSTGIITYV